MILVILLKFIHFKFDLFQKYICIINNGFIALFIGVVTVM